MPSFPFTQSTIMAPANKTRKRTPKISEPSISSNTSITVSLGEEEPSIAPSIAAPAPPLDPTPSIESAYPLEPLIPNDTIIETQEDYTKEEKLVWTEEMIEQLIETLQEVFESGGSADNSFKKATFELAAQNVIKVYKGARKITQQHCKNKWGDIKAKWASWKFLGEQSGFGWNEVTELYEAYDYVWTALNNAHPGLIWHKTHVMPYRESISLILHDVQANGKGALTIEVPTPIDPRIAALKPTSSASRASSVAPKTPYNRS